jgi:hypothetical protein
MEALGRSFNTVPAADGVYVSMKDAAACSFICYLGGAAGDTYTLVEAKDAAGTGAQNLVAITQYYTNTGNATDAWVKRTQAAAATVVAAATAVQQAVVFNVDASKLSDTYKYIKVTSTGAGTVNALLHSLEVQRTPANLAIVGV